MPAIRAASALSYSLKPRAIAVPSDTTSTTSPRLNLPSTTVAPAASRLAPLPSARAAPASMLTRPLTVKRPASHALRALLALSATNNVPHSSRASRANGCGVSPETMMRSAPAAFAIRAASIFDAIPPEPIPDEVDPFAIAAIFAVIASTRAIRVAVESVDGSDVYNPSTSESRITHCARAACAMRAASRSLSPKRISVVATESFSLMTGTTPRLSNRSSVADAFK